MRPVLFFPVFSFFFFSSILKIKPRIGIFSFRVSKMYEEKKCKQTNKQTNSKDMRVRHDARRNEKIKLFKSHVMSTKRFKIKINALKFCRVREITSIIIIMMHTNELYFYWLWLRDSGTDHICATWRKNNFSNK